MHGAFTGVAFETSAGMAFDSSVGDSSAEDEEGSEDDEDRPWLLMSWLPFLPGLEAWSSIARGPFLSPMALQSSPLW